jgi:excisionase family DNA binding protein
MSRSLSAPSMTSVEKRPSASDQSRQSPPRTQVAPAQHPLGYRINDACRLAGIGRTSIYKLIGDGQLAVVKVGGRTLVVGDSLRALFQIAP